MVVKFLLFNKIFNKNTIFKTNKICKVRNTHQHKNLNIKKVRDTHLTL